jgi:outer membrane protein assembly factor BamB
MSTLPPEHRRFSIHSPRLLWIGLTSAVVVILVAVYCRRPGEERPQPVTREIKPDEGPKNEELWRAAKMGQADVVETLLNEGLEVDAETDYGVTALQFAAGRGHLDVVRVLLAHDANVNQRDRFYGIAPLWWAASKQHWKVVAALLEAGASGADEILPVAAAAGAVDAVRTALQRVINEEVLDRALAATPEGQTEVIELLESAGARRPEADPAETKEYELPLTKFAGTYSNEAGFELGVALAGKRLSLTLDDKPIAVLVRTGEVTFTAADDVTAKFEFQQEGDQIIRFVRTHNDATTRFERSRIPQTSHIPPDEIDDSGDVVPQNWPSFRGRQATGVADGQKPPITWDVKTRRNVRWKTPIAGLAHACPIVWDDRVYVVTAVRVEGRSELRVGLYGDVDSADDQTEHSWRICCLDNNSGDVVWDRTAHSGVPRTKRHTKGSHANCTPATDGTHVVANFGSEGLYCYERDGRLLWHHDLGTLESGWFFDDDYQWGFGSSPIIYRDLVIIQCDVGRGSSIAAFRLADGNEAWRTSRDEIPSWGSPTVVEGPERAELVTNATHFARGYDPLTGSELWRLGPNSEITVPTPFYGERLIFIVSGYSSKQPIYAIHPGASGDISLRENEASNKFVSWSKAKAGSYLPTPIAYRGQLYVCSNSGIVACYDAATGREIYKRRLPGRGAYTASPVAADGRLYFTNEEGQVTVLKAGAEFEVLAQNALGEVCLSTPAISDAAIYFRTEGHVVAVGRPRPTRP